MAISNEKKIQKIIDQLAKTATKDLPEKLQDIHELRTGERKPIAPLLFGYPSTDDEVAAYERVLRRYGNLRGPHGCPIAWRHSTS
jgi:hypothetical protein